MKGEAYPTEYIYNVRFDTVLLELSGYFFGFLREVQGNVLRSCRQSMLCWRPPRQAVDLLPSVRRLTQRSKHVMTRDAIGTRDYCGKVLISRIVLAKDR